MWKSALMLAILAVGSPANAAPKCHLKLTWTPFCFGDDVKSSAILYKRFGLSQDELSHDYVRQSIRDAGCNVVHDPNHTVAILPFSKGGIATTSGWVPMVIGTMNAANQYIAAIAEPYLAGDCSKVSAAAASHRP